MPREVQELNARQQSFAMEQANVELIRACPADGNSHMLDFDVRTLSNGKNSIHNGLSDQSSPVKSPGSISPRR